MNNINVFLVHPNEIIGKGLCLVLRNEGYDQTHYIKTITSLLNLEKHDGIHLALVHYSEAKDLNDCIKLVNKAKMGVVLFASSDDFHNDLVFYNQI